MILNVENVRGESGSEPVLLRSGTKSSKAFHYLNSRIILVFDKGSNDISNIHRKDFFYPKAKKTGYFWV